MLFRIALILVLGYLATRSTVSAGDGALAVASLLDVNIVDAGIVAESDMPSLANRELWNSFAEVRVDSVNLNHPSAKEPPTPPLCRDSSVTTVDWQTECPPSNQYTASTHAVLYDRGWVLRPHDPAKTPFELKIEFHDQFRHTGYSRSVSTYTDNAGNTFDITNRNDFDINRGRLVFSGYVFDPKVRFYTNIDYNTVAEDQVQLLLSWLEYEFSEYLTVSAGLVKVPGTWEWQESSRYTLGAERTMATTFFRPSITAGIWAHGKLTDTLSYDFTVGDGFNTFTLRAAEVDNNFVYSGMVWWEPLGDFGVGFTSLGQNEEPLFRAGQGLTYTRTQGTPAGTPGPEQTFIRLSDGTRITTPGALAPGATVNEFDILLYSPHVGFKYRRMSLSGEYFFRWLTNIEADAPIPDNTIFDHGFMAQAGYFVVPDRWELFGRGSAVYGDLGSGSETAVGLNFYPRGQLNTRFTFDVAHLDDPPTEQDRTGFVVGGSGLLFRTQLWMFF